MSAAREDESTNSQVPRTKGMRRPQGSMLAALLGALVFGGISFVAMYAAPVSLIELTREAGSVSAHVEVCVFFRLPIRVENLAPITGVNYEIHQGEKLHKRAGDGVDSNHRAESEGFLILLSPDKPLKVSVYWRQAKETQQRVEKFLADPEQDRLSFRVIAHPIVGQYVPIFLLLPLTALCVMGLVGGGIHRMIYAIYVLSSKASD